jgi:hypothetical protein
MRLRLGNDHRVYSEVRSLTILKLPSWQSNVTRRSHLWFPCNNWLMFVIEDDLEILQAHIPKPLLPGQSHVHATTHAAHFEF